MKNVLWLSLADYNLEKEDQTLKKKFENLSRGVNVFVLARGKRGKYSNYNCSFYLLPKKFGKIGIVWWLIRSYFLAKKIIKQNQIDVIISQSPVIDGLVSSFLKKTTNTELIIETHGDWVDSAFYYHKIPCEKILKKIIQLIGRYTLRQADKIRVISRATENQVKKYSQNKNIYKFPAFTDIDIFKNEDTILNKPIIVFVGWLYRIKGVQFLIEAFNRVQQKYPESFLKIIGDGPYVENLKAVTAGKQVKNVLFLGWQDQEKIKDILRECRCLVLPSLSEGLGRVIIEAAMLKKPCIGSNVGGIPDIIKDEETGFLFEPGNIEQLTEKLDILLKNSEKAKIMGEKGRELAEKIFSTDRYFQNYFNMINDKI